MRVIFEISSHALDEADMHPEDKLHTIRDAIADAFCVSINDVNLLEVKNQLPDPKIKKEEGVKKVSYPYSHEGCGFSGVDR